jgi:transcription termination factor NusB
LFYVYFILVKNRKIEYLKGNLMSRVIFFCMMMQCSLLIHAKEKNSIDTAPLPLISAVSQARDVKKEFASLKLARSSRQIERNLMAIIPVIATGILFTTFDNRFIKFERRYIPKMLAEFFATVGVSSMFMLIPHWIMKRDEVRIEVFQELYKEELSNISAVSQARDVKKEFVGLKLARNSRQMERNITSIIPVVAVGILIASFESRGMFPRLDDEAELNTRRIRRMLADLVVTLGFSSMFMLISQWRMKRAEARIEIFQELYKEELSRNSEKKK